MDNNDYTFRRYKDGDHEHLPWQEDIVQASWSHKCPTYVQRTPPCQGSCPSGEDIRSWLQIVNAIEPPPGDMPWQEYAFRRSTDANPFPAVMGRVCPAPCQEGCNRNEVDDFVGINSVEQFIGDYALSSNLQFEETGEESGKRVAIIGGGVAGLAAAYQLRRRGHGCTIFDEHSKLGGMMRYGIPGYRTPRDVLDGEMQRIVNMGVEIRLNTRVGRDIELAELERDYDAILIAIGAQAGRALPVDGGDAPNCITGVAFLEAFNDERLTHAAEKVVVIGGGDTAMDVVSVARRLGHVKNAHENERPENIILNQTAQDVATAARHDGAEVVLAYRRPIDKMPAALHEVETAQQEGVTIRGSLSPVKVVVGDDGRATALRVVEVDWSSGSMVTKEGSEFDIECDLIVAAIGQSGDLSGLEEFDNGRGLVDADKFYQVPNKPGYFVAGDIIRPHLLTTAIGQASIAADTIDQYLDSQEYTKRPKVDVHHFDLLEKLREFELSPDEYSHQQDWGTDKENFAVHNFEDRSAFEIIPSDKLFLGHFPVTPRSIRKSVVVTAENVLGHFEERNIGLSDEEARKEAERCMSCGMCFECDNCIIYCPQDAVSRVAKKESATGRYVITDYGRCIGCHICAEVCPTGYIEMGLG
ncbi:MAG: NAD(P)-binding protein [Gammaproteobacteria bacterium]|nr:MAG: NAD(P)-binding protein [Gammaproteobacteria bacterium]